MSESGESVVGVPRNALPDHFHPSEIDTDVYVPINGLAEIRTYLRKVREHKEARQREDAELDTDFQQLVVHSVLVKGDSVFAVENAHTDHRLKNTLSLGLGGHCTPEDASLIDTFYREFAEEVAVKRNGDVIPYQDGKERLIKEFVEIHPVGIIKDDRDDVGKSHIGVVCLVTPKDESVDFALQTESGVEEREGKYMKIEEIAEQVKLGSIQVNGWGDVVLRNVLLPRLKNSTV